MRPLLRLGFAALILLGLASQALRAGRSDDGADPRHVLAGRLDRLHVRTEDLPDHTLLVARSGLCDQPFLAGVSAIDGVDDETTRQLAVPGIVVRYAYLGRVGPRPSRTALEARWGWETVLFTVGLRQARPPRHMALVAFPQGCTRLDAVDWAALSPAG